MGCARSVSGRQQKGANRSTEQISTTPRWCFPAGSGDEDVTGLSQQVWMGMVMQELFPAPFGMVKTGSSEMETLQSYVCLQSCLSPVV